MNLALVSEGAAYTVWWISLGIGVVVIVVVAVLLTLIVRTARQIEGAAADIWTVGQRIANNTVHIPLLNRTNRLVGGILESASGIDGATARIEEHALDCPG
ncbi:MAG: hypothetical protein AVDCRST_MAG37-774 [uncultured Rubrobacteraceae bacterium]|jgi:hypothetical protein|uniref:Uncharacterized protein n=1 Tax=uncultured Rubrobacteraceae bacterium TaxID=349277 RepID=A0A6J4QBV1_9ACTN|nr:MAG: hypothetical protein AVDCRST_MAG37-774 [uncultured Rubrobacteraceae bacterium]